MRLRLRMQRLIVETDGGAAHGTRRAKRRDPLRDGDLMIADWRVWRLSYERVLHEPDAVAEQLIGLGITPVRPPAAPGARRRR
jgi:very-short-patch-repair endonuclease